MKPIEYEETADSSALTKVDEALPMDVRVHATISALEDEMERRFPLLKLPVRHVFANGSYLREMEIPAGTLITSMIHREQHLVIVSKGAIEVWTEGKGSETVVAPATFVSQPGTRRVGFAYEDTVWATVHPNPTNETDTKVLEERLYWTRHQLGFSAEQLKMIDQKLLGELLPKEFTTEVA